MKGSVVRVESATKRFGDFEALKGVSITINRGEFFSLLGPSGCGKTTLLRIIAGFEQPSDGVVFIDDVNILPIPANRRAVNTVFQNYALFPHLTVFENIAFPLRLKKTADSQVRTQVAKYVDLVHLAGQEQKKPNQLSGGQRQRVAIARALINEPAVLLLDEPLSALDAKLRQQLLIDLDTIHDQVGITFIYVTHDQAEALSVSDRVAVMNEGRVVQIGAPHEIYESPADVFVARFIGESNLFKGTVERVDGAMVTVAVDHIGLLRVTVSPDGRRSVVPGRSVYLSIRPEKISISKNPPNQPADGFNVLSGEVDERIYAGFQSKFFVKSPNNVMFRVFKQHNNYLDDGPGIAWKDHVHFWWNPDDGYIIEPSDLTN